MTAGAADHGRFVYTVLHRISPLSPAAWAIRTGHLRRYRGAPGPAATLRAPATALVSQGAYSTTLGLHLRGPAVAFLVSTEHRSPAPEGPLGRITRLRVPDSPAGVPGALRGTLGPQGQRAHLFARRGAGCSQAVAPFHSAFVLILIRVGDNAAQWLEGDRRTPIGPRRLYGLHWRVLQRAGYPPSAPTQETNPRTRLSHGESLPRCLATTQAWAARSWLFTPYVPP
jgi:hypothetical protein